jgi:hypothetical protein
MIDPQDVNLARGLQLFRRVDRHGCVYAAATISAQIRPA